MSWLPVVCSHKLPKPSAPWWEKSIEYMCCIVLHFISEQVGLFHSVIFLFFFLYIYIMLVFIVEWLLHLLARSYCSFICPVWVRMCAGSSVNRKICVIIFVLKILCKTFLRSKKILLAFNYLLRVLKIVHVFSFCTPWLAWNFFNSENFPICCISSSSNSSLFLVGSIWNVLLWEKMVGGNLWTCQATFLVFQVFLALCSVHTCSAPEQWAIRLALCSVHTCSAPEQCFFYSNSRPSLLGELEMLLSLIITFVSYYVSLFNSHSNAYLFICP